MKYKISIEVERATNNEGYTSYNDLYTQVVECDKLDIAPIIQAVNESYETRNAN